MSKAALQITRTTVQRWFTLQSIVVIIVSLATLLVGLEPAGSVLIGGILCILPTVLFARWWFAEYQAGNIGRLVKIFYIGEILKLVLTGLLFVLAMVFFPVQLLWCLTGYMAAQISFWLAPLFIRYR